MDYKKYYQYTLNEIELLKKNYKYNINQEKISKILIKYPKILRYQDENGNNLGMVACQVKLSRIILASLCDPVASNQVNVYGNTIAMYCAYYDVNDVLDMLLCDSEVCRKQNKSGMTLGMIMANNRRTDEQLLLKALDDDSCVLQNDDGKNIGMFCALSKFKQATLKAMENKDIRRQIDKYGKNIFDHAKNVFSIKEYNKLCEQYNYKRMLGKSYFEMRMSLVKGKRRKIYK